MNDEHSAGHGKVIQVVLDLRPDQSYNGPPKRYIWLGFEVLMVAPTGHMIASEHLGTSLYLWPFATSCSHTTAIYCVFCQLQCSLYDCHIHLMTTTEKTVKLSMVTCLMTCLMTSIIYNHNFRLNYTCKLRSTCIYF